MEPDGCLSLWFGFAFWACGPRSPLEGPKQRKREQKERKATGTPEAAESQEIQGRKRGGKCNRRALRIYKGPRSRQGVPGKEAERMEPDGWLSLWFGFAFWACGPRSPPEGPKQRRREKKERKATGTPEAAESQEIQGRKRGGKCNRRALHIYKGPRSRQGVPGKEAERMEPDGCLSLWFGLAFWAFGPRSPPEGPKQRRREKKERKATGTPEAAESQEIQGRKRGGKCNRRALHIYKGPRSRQGVPGKEAERMEPDGWLSLWFGLAFWACGPRSPPEGPKQRRREKKERKATGTPEAAESQEIQGRKRGGKCNRRALHIYKGPRSRQGVPGKEAERMEPDGCLSLWFGLAFWACGPRSPPEGPKQRRREKKERKATGTPEAAESQEIQGRKRGGKCNRRALHIYKGPRSRQGVPGKEAERMEPDGWLSLWFGFAFWACGPRSPPEGPKQRRREKKGRKATGTPEAAESQEIQGRKRGGKCNRRALHIYKGPRSRQGVPGKEVERMEPDGWLSLWFGFAFWACGPRSPPEGPKQRRREQKGRKATGTPEAAESQEIQGRKRGGKCNRRALHIYKGPRSRQGVPGKEAERMEPDGWLSLWFGLAFWACSRGNPVPARGPQAEKKREEGGKEGNGDARSSREPGDSRKEARREVQQTGVAYI